MKTVCVQTVGKGNVIKMKQKKTEDSIKRTAKPSVRKVGTMLGSVEVESELGKGTRVRMKKAVGKGRDIWTTQSL